MTEKLVWIKLKDITGETYEYEDCEMKEGPFSIIIFFVAPIGTVRKQFFKKNLVSFELLREIDKRKE